MQMFWNEILKKLNVRLDKVKICNVMRWKCVVMSSRGVFINAIHLAGVKKILEVCEPGKHQYVAREVVILMKYTWFQTWYSMHIYPVQCRWNYLSIHKLHRLYRWSSGMDKYCHPALYDGCIYLSMLGLKLDDVSKRVSRGVEWRFCS